MKKNTTDLMLNCDLHIHTDYSRDGESSVEEIIARAVKTGLDVIAITDHDTVEGALKAVEYAKENYPELLVIPGIEISTKQGHLIALGITEAIPAKIDFEQTVAAAREKGAFLILPHPFHQWRHGAALKVKDAIRIVDAVESFNSRYIFGTANKKAERKAAYFNKTCVGGSDAHNAKFVGYGRTIIDAEKDQESVFTAIKEGNVEIMGKMTPIRSYTRQSFRNTKKKIARRVYRR